MTWVSNKFLSFAIVFVMLLPCFTFFETTTSSTSISGAISSDTTWTKENSPYNLNESVTVESGVTLTIEAGVTVELNGYRLQVDGILRAIGSDTEKVVFEGGKIVFSTSSVGWDEQSSSGCIIQDASINKTTIASSNAIKVSKSSISGLDDATSAALSVGGLSVISDNTIISTYGKGHGITVKNGLASIHDNIISGFAIGIWAASPASIERNTIVNCGVGIGVGKIIGTSIDSYEFAEVSAAVTENTIANNYIGIGGPIFNGKTAISNIVATGEVTAQKNYRP